MLWLALETWKICNIEVYVCTGWVSSLLLDTNSTEGYAWTRSCIQAGLFSLSTFSFLFSDRNQSFALILTWWQNEMKPTTSSVLCAVLFIFTISQSIMGPWLAVLIGNSVNKEQNHLWENNPYTVHKFLNVLTPTNLFKKRSFIQDWWKSSVLP